MITVYPYRKKPVANASVQVLDVLVLHVVTAVNAVPFQVIQCDVGRSVITKCITTSCGILSGAKECLLIRVCERYR